jgi:hypothetical protein
LVFQPDTALRDALTIRVITAVGLAPESTADDFRIMAFCDHCGRSPTNLFLDLTWLETYFPARGSSSYYAAQ